MSAVFGVVRYDNQDPRDHNDRLAQLLGALGPDGIDSWTEGNVSVGRGLTALLAEDRFDRQPVISASGRYVVVADVRLSEREDLAEQLDLSGTCERLADSTLVTAAIDRWDEAAFDRIYGDFAIAAWDKVERRLLLARDHLGHRPLFFHRSEAYLAFASMPVAILGLPEVPRQADSQQMRRFLRLLGPSPGKTHYEGIERVDPGCFAIVTGGSVEQTRYWRPDLSPLILPTHGDYEKLLSERFEHAIAASLRGHGPEVGAHLSSGFDSSSVVASAAMQLQKKNARLVAFTAVPREGGSAGAPSHRLADEGPLAATVAQLHSNITHVKISPREHTLSHLDRGNAIYGQPTLNLCNHLWIDMINDDARRRGLRIMLEASMGNLSISETGLAALPELFAARRYVAWSKVSSGLVRTGWMRWRGVIWNTISPFLPSRVWSWGEKINGRTSLPHGRYSALRSDAWAQATADAAVDAVEASRNPGAQAMLVESGQPSKTALEDRLAQLADDVGSSNKGNLLAWGVDLRDPTADRRLVELSLRIPVEEMIWDGQPRTLLRRIMKGRLPDAVLNNRQKGLQAADWAVNLGAAKSAAAAEIDRIEMFEPSAEMLDVGRLHTLLEDWPEPGSPDWNSPDMVADYRCALLRGVSAAAFMRKAAGSNY